MLKYTLPHFLQRLFPAITWKVKTVDKAVFLTFDDGPHPEITPWVLQELDRYDAKATFFCVGENVVKFPDTYKAMLSKGHSAGNHSYNHLNGWKTADNDYFGNIEKCATVVDSKMFRPPYGKITLSQLRYLRKKYEVVMWDMLTGDYEEKLNCARVMETIKKHIGPGSVVVFHDSVKAEKNLKVMLPELLRFLKHEGYEMKSL